ncbi:K(+) efflux antiporter 2, chloroplastic-like isoform X2 [Camellia sinensis]|uniref:K(+) efflux antiporter 2, chloroplastic-like isoform X2 n=1 Tax=Camellia sinensis TaxID=4442 RepID=UPI0010368F6C|nr:K(+) efflux antiporter 2, chloroplastic-like isoform X2 [Camellia sinensis]
MYCKALHGELVGDIAVVGRLFGISIISAIRVGLLLAPGGEFAFVAFGEAVNQTDDLQDHIIICGFGRVGQIIAQLLSERLIPFVALDVRRFIV